MPSAAVRKVELRYRLYAKILDIAASLIHHAIPWGCVALVAYFGYRSVASLSGHDTFAQIAVKFWADFRVGEYVPYLFGASGIFYGVRNRKLRKDTIESMAAQIKKLEQQIDKRRSSSRLTPRGETRPEDKT